MYIMLPYLKISERWTQDDTACLGIFDICPKNFEIHFNCYVALFQVLFAISLYNNTGCRKREKDVQKHEHKVKFELSVSGLNELEWSTDGKYIYTAGI